LVTKDGKAGYIDSQGKLTIPAQFEKAFPFAGEFAVVVSNGPHRLPASGTHLAIAASARRRLRVLRGRRRRAARRAVGFLDTNAQWVVPAQYEAARKFLGRPGAGERSRASGVTSTSRASSRSRRSSKTPIRSSEGLALVQQGGKWGFIDPSGTVVWRPTSTTRSISPRAWR
jgi:hypothetical protein